MAFGQTAEGHSLTPEETKLASLLASAGWTCEFDVASGPGNEQDTVTFHGSGDARRARIRLVCDRRDYSRVFRVEMYDPSGRLSSLRVSEGFDADGFPRRVYMESYDSDGNVRTWESITVLKANLHPWFPEDLFEFRPPPGYGVMDARRSPPVTVRERDLVGARVAGETLGQILEGETGDLFEHRKPGAVEIELPSSRPTSQPTERSGVGR